MSSHSEETWENFDALWQRVQALSRQIKALETRLDLLERSDADPRVSKRFGSNFVYEREIQK